MPEIVVVWDHRFRGISEEKRTTTQNEIRYPVDTHLRIDPAPEYCRLMRLERGVWIEEFTTPSQIHLEVRGYA